MGSLGVGMANKTEFTIQLKDKSEKLKTNSEKINDENAVMTESTETFMRRLRDSLQEDYSGINFSMMTLGLIPRTGIDSANGAHRNYTQRK